MKILEFKNVAIKYGRHLALSDVSFSIEKGEYLCLIGENGSGKSSLLKAVLGLLPVAAGEICLNTDKSSIAYVPQTNLADRAFPATVEEIVLLGTQTHGSNTCFYGKTAYAAAKDAMKKMNISAIAKKSISQLSGGQLQRVFLARALCKNPEIIILDEPCAGLDPNMTRELYDIIYSLNKNSGATVIMATHDLKEVESRGERVVALENSILFDGTVNEWKAGGFIGR